MEELCAQRQWRRRLRRMCCAVTCRLDSAMDLHALCACAAGTSTDVGQTTPLEAVLAVGLAPMDGGETLPCPIRTNTMSIARSCRATSAYLAKCPHFTCLGSSAVQLDSPRMRHPSCAALDYP